MDRCVALSNSSRAGVATAPPVHVHIHVSKRSVRTAKSDMFVMMFSRRRIGAHIFLPETAVLAGPHGLQQKFVPNLTSTRVALVHWKTLSRLWRKSYCWILQILYSTSLKNPAIPLAHETKNGTFLEDGKCGHFSRWTNAGLAAQRRTYSSYNVALIARHGLNKAKKSSITFWRSGTIPAWFAKVTERHASGFCVDVVQSWQINRWKRTQHTCSREQKCHRFMPNSGKDCFDCKQALFEDCQQCCINRSAFAASCVENTAYITNLFPNEAFLEDFH